MKKSSNSTLPKTAMNTGTLLVAIGITFAIMVIALVLIIVELKKWKQFQAQANNPSLIRTILVRQ